ncbi:Fe-containing alcohol dehydrogenase [Favolaschia claudopus]|uniref:Fe-containing alcohol dehydrogenase n=1 Tax=Favolaschia claudopus TaxID=2862362 RepID=A0AAV9ZFJ5_9AGAR
MPSQETLRSAVPPYDGPLPPSLVTGALSSGGFNNCNVSYGLPFHEACAKHAEDTFHATRVMILASATLARTTAAVSDLQAALGVEKVVLIKTGLRSHTMFSESLAIAEECRVLGVDLIITLGGGSLTDAAKLISLILGNDVKTPDQLLQLPTLVTLGKVPPANPPSVPVICISTTLSGGEFTVGCGATDDRDNQKHQFITSPSPIRLVVFDAALVTRTTPSLLFSQSGVRALDHCIEALCSPYRNEVTEGHARASLLKLVPGLLACRYDEGGADVEARLRCQMACVDAIAAFGRVYTPLGGSHAIGHVLGPFGVVHGATSGILLPAVCKYNARHSKEAKARQGEVARILWGIEEMRGLAERKGLKEGEGGADLGDLLDVFVRELGMARTLKEVGVGRDRFGKLAEFGVRDGWAATNPVPLTKEEQVTEILEMVA